ncbi:hypothetical protein BMS3Abin12_02309 [bacterium BMS3Abin12]|nr:hypothetical protein BMS3Abin12_02309 [bacterium BMS3Abin12]
MPSYIDFDTGACFGYVRRLHPDIEIPRLSARAGEEPDRRMEGIVAKHTLAPRPRLATPEAEPPSLGTPHRGPPGMRPIMLVIDEPRSIETITRVMDEKADGAAIFPKGSR